MTTAPLQGADTKGECLEVEYKVLLEVSADWVECPQMLLLPFNGRNFEVKVGIFDLVMAALKFKPCGLEA